MVLPLCCSLIFPCLERGCLRTSAVSLSIVGECSSIEEHCLCAMPETAVGSLTSVLSHPAMFEQCSQFLKKLDADRGERLTREAHWDTAAACTVVKEGKMAHAAAISSREASTRNGLDILESGIGNGWLMVF